MKNFPRNAWITTQTNQAMFGLPPRLWVKYFSFLASYFLELFALTKERETFHSTK